MYSWPFEEARKVLDRVNKKGKKSVLFETGYGPSGLPHIGTFCEVARTSFIKRALAEISDIPSRLYAFSDDMDGLRKVPDDVPNRDMLSNFLHYPLTKVPDPFGCCESFGHHNNNQLIKFLTECGFDFEYKSSTECYKSGIFDHVLLEILKKHQAILDIMLPSLGDDRRATYSPFLPISPKTNKVLQVPIKYYNIQDGTIVFNDEDGSQCEIPVTGGACKLQWKVDWAMRWVALDVDYEMYGKDLIDTMKLSKRISKVLNYDSPEGFFYEIFVDRNGQKISKSKGNSEVTMPDWLNCGIPEGLLYYMFQSPQSTKKMIPEIIPKSIDEYYDSLMKYPTQDRRHQLDNPVWHIHAGSPIKKDNDINFSLLVNIITACSVDNQEDLCKLLEKRTPNINKDQSIQKLINNSIAYYKKFVDKKKIIYQKTEQEILLLNKFSDGLLCLNDTSENAIQQFSYDFGKNNCKDIKEWFKLLYNVLIGQDSGPKIGTFIGLCGIEKVVSLLKK